MRLVGAVRARGAGAQTEDELAKSALDPFPGARRTQLLGARIGDTRPYLPAGQDSHAPEPEAYHIPSGQDWHALRLAAHGAADEPSGQGSQWPRDAAPERTPYVPAGQHAQSATVVAPVAVL